MSIWNRNLSRKTALKIWLGGTFIAALVILFSLMFKTGDGYGSILNIYISVLLWVAFSLGMVIITATDGQKEGETKDSRLILVSVFLMIVIIFGLYFLFQLF